MAANSLRLAAGVAFLSLLLLAVTVYSFALRPDSASAAIFVVNSTGDLPDATPGDGICATATPDCTLRAAIGESNVLAGADLINFSISGAGPHTIAPLSALPNITASVIIDGYSEPGASANTNAIELGSNAVLMIELDGTGAGPANGLTITAGSSTIKGLVINRFGYGGMEILGAAGNVVQGNYIGTDVNGIVDLGNTNWGVLVNGASSNTIGGTVAGARNVISGNNNHGVEIGYSSAVTGNLVQGNYIGTDATGSADLGNSGNGVFINGAPGNTIGGSVAAARNVISGNNNHGIGIGFGSAVTGNLVQGNYVGTDATGSADLGNSVDGVISPGRQPTQLAGLRQGPATYSPAMAPAACSSRAVPQRQEISCRGTLLAQT